MFGKNVEKSCSYCVHGYMLSNNRECVCKKYGIIKGMTKCKHFEYDPLKRIPSRTPSVPDYRNGCFDINA